MQYRTLGSTGLSVSEIGFGAWGIGGLSEGASSYGPTNDKESEAALQLAFERGITFYDTADIYGNGHSEELIGRVFKPVRDKVVIATKVGFLGHNKPHDFSETHIRSSLEGSLGRLQTDYVDLYQLHSPPIEILQKEPEIMDIFKELQEEGKIRACGISVKHPKDGLIAVNEFGIKSVQVNFSMIDQRALDCGLLDLALEKNVGIIVRTPFNFGFLTGKLEGKIFDSRDHRSSWSEEQRKRWTEAPKLFANLNWDKKRSLAQLALKFCLNFQAVSSVIPGMLIRWQVDENVSANGLKDLSADEVNEIRKVYRNNIFFG